MRIRLPEIRKLQIRPIISALWRNKTAMILISLQIALTLAVFCNALFIISQRLNMMGRPSGMDERNTFLVSSNGFGARFNVNAATAADLSMLRNLPGVNATAPVLTVPLHGGGWTEDVDLARDQKHPTTDDVAIYYTDDHGLEAYGVSLIAGRNFTADEISSRDEHANRWPPGVIITEALAQRLFLDEPAVGKQFYLDGTAPMTVLGVIARLQHFDPHHRNDAGDADIVEYSIIVPQIFSTRNHVNYLIRTEPGRRDELMKSVEQKLIESNRSRAVEGIVSIEQIRSEAYSEDRAIAIILGGVIFALLVISALGISGLANFWVAQRTKQIGVRRALGATRSEILRYFQTENFIITTLGLIVGSAFTYALSIGLMLDAKSGLLPWYYVPCGFVALWTLGQIAVLAPALNASRVPPTVATRSA